MIREIMLWLAKRQIRALELPNQRGMGTHTQSNEILEIFVQGVEASLRQRNAADVAKMESSIGWHRRFFFWEGYAFGLAGMAAMTWRRPHPDTLKIIPHYRSMHFTGYGFWNGLMGGVPFLGLPEKAERWKDVPDSDRLLPLFWGGASFSEVVFGGGMGYRTIRRAEKTGGDLAALGALHGCGRALWWLYMNNPEGLEASLDLQESHLRGVMEGVGLAIGFVNILEPEKIPELIERFDPSLHGALRGGVGVTMQAIVEEHPEHASRMADIDIPVLNQAYRVAEAASRDIPVNGQWYGQCVDYIRGVL